MAQPIAFYAPLKSPDHPNPSGDRAMARGLMAALRDIPGVSGVDLVSELRSRDGVGDADVQSRLLQQAEDEVARILDTAQHWSAWVTYHNYYKAPDLLGPALTAALGIPYVIVEASRSPAKLNGPWARFAHLSEAACDAADAIFYMTDRDFPALNDAKPETQNLIHLAPFLNRSDLPQLATLADGKLVVVAMMRAGDKLASYQNLAQALRHVQIQNWSLDIVGDGPENQQVRHLFQEYGDNVRFLGRLTASEVEIALSQAKVFVWPGVNEAFGMVYLEAQALGLRAVAEDRPGVRDVIARPELLAPQNDERAMAQAIDEALADVHNGSIERRFIGQSHLRAAATATLSETLKILWKAQK